MADHEKSNRSDSDGKVEELSHLEDSPPLKLDRHGLPFVPQPSNHEDDPLVSIALTEHLAKLTVLELAVLAKGIYCWAGGNARIHITA